MINSKASPSKNNIQIQSYYNLIQSSKVILSFLFLQCMVIYSNYILIVVDKVVR